MRWFHISSRTTKNILVVTKYIYITSFARASTPLFFLLVSSLARSPNILFFFILFCKKYKRVFTIWYIIEKDGREMVASIMRFFFFLSSLRLLRLSLVIVFCFSSNFTLIYFFSSHQATLLRVWLRVREKSCLVFHHLSS